MNAAEHYRRGEELLAAAESDPEDSTAQVTALLAQSHFAAAQAATEMFGPHFDPNPAEPRKVPCSLGKGLAPVGSGASGTCSQARASESVREPKGGGP